MSGATYVCAVCGTPVRRGMLMCSLDWRRVPRPLQRAVNASWFEFRRANHGYKAIVAMDAYRKVAGEAVDAVRLIVAERNAA